MKVDVTQKLYQVDGKTPMQDVVNGEAVDATLRMALVNALLNPSKKQEDGMTKVKNYDLAMRVYKETEIEINEDDIKLLKEKVGEAFPSPLIVGQVYKLLSI